MVVCVCVYVIGRDRGLHLLIVKVITTRMIETVIVQDQTTQTQKMDIRGNVTGRGLMGDSASSCLVWLVESLGGCRTMEGAVWALDSIA